MGRKQLVRDVKQAALARVENAARTVEDFQAVIKLWDDLDENRERKERAHEERRDKMPLEEGRKKDGLVFPAPFDNPTEQAALMGDFIDMIYDNAGEIWQLVEDWDVFIELKELKARQKEVLFLMAVRLCTPQQIACYKGQTDRAVRKLLVATLASIRGKLAESIREQIWVGMADMTLTKRQFLEWYDGQKIALDNDKSE